MNDIEFGTHAGLRATDPESVGDTDKAEPYPTPAEVLAPIGRVIVFCLGLAVLAHVIVVLAGAQ